MHGPLTAPFPPFWFEYSVRRTESTNYEAWAITSTLDRRIAARKRAPLDRDILCPLINPRGGAGGHSWSVQ